MRDLAISIGPRQLLAPTSFQIERGMRVGLVGRNGAGKTTMTRLLAGEETDLSAIDVSGQINSSSPVAYLPQDPRSGDLEQNAMSRVLSARNIDRILEKIRQAEHKMATTTGGKQAAAMERYTRLDHEFTVQGGWAAHAEASQIMAALGLPQRVFTQPLEQLSGGQRRRVELARVLFSGADVLLLDEPTNHLDHDSIVWLREYLQSYPGGFLVISHDINLVRDTVNTVFYLDANRGELDIYRLGWDAYLRQREDDERRRKREASNAQKKAATLQAQGEKMRAKATKAVAAQQMLRRAAELRDSVATTAVEKVAALRFPEPAPCGKIPLQASALSKTYGSLEVFTAVDLSIDRGTKVVVLGLNGAGKTTLLRILAGIEPSDTGEVQPGHGLKLGYYAQEHETIDPELSVLENMEKAATDMADTEVRSILGSFLFSGDDVNKPARVLSGGEKTRLALAALVVSAANVLLLDEPTNNLDPASRAEVLKALQTFAGAVVLVTHDPGAVVALQPDRVLLLPDGDEDYWSEDYLDLVTLV